MKDFSFVFTNKPVNGSASAVLQKGEHCELEIKHQMFISQVPIKVNKFTGPESEDLTGVKFGRFLVVGYLSKGNWLLKCRCGIYTKKKSAKIKKTISGFFDDNIECVRDNTMCSKCISMEKIKHPEYQKGNWGIIKNVEGGN